VIERVLSDSHVFSEGPVSGGRASASGLHITCFTQITSICTTNNVYSVVSTHITASDTINK
jgi:hypothetical protein